MFCINAQFWNGDRSNMMALARLIADLEPSFREDVYFLFTARFDCEHDEETISYVSKKFKVLRHTTRRKATGWPAGPNQMMADSYSFVIERNRMRNLGISVILFMEADDLPLHPNWINMLWDEWKKSGKQVSGAWLKKGDAGCEHINGNCLIGINFWKISKGILSPPSKGGWDAVLSGIILPHGHPSKLIWSDYHLGTERNPWRGCDYLWAPKRYGSPENALYGQDIYPALLHGPKCLDGIECVRARFLSK